MGKGKPLPPPQLGAPEAAVVPGGTLKGRLLLRNRSLHRSEMQTRTEEETKGNIP